MLENISSYISGQCNRCSQIQKSISLVLQLHLKALGWAKFSIFVHNASDQNISAASKCVPETAQWAHSDFIPCSIIAHCKEAPKGRVKEQFLHMLGTLHALEQTHTYFSSSEFWPCFHNCFSSRGRKSVLVLVCLIGPAEPVLTRFPPFCGI